MNSISRQIADSTTRRQDDSSSLAVAPSTYLTGCLERLGIKEHSLFMIALVNVINMIKHYNNTEIMFCLLEGIFKYCTQSSIIFACMTKQLAALLI